MKQEDLGDEIPYLKALNRAQMTAITAKALTVKTKHPSTASVELDPSGVNSSEPLQEVVPLETTRGI